MSVQVNHYVVWGVCIHPGARKVTLESLEPYIDSPFKGIEHHNGLCVLYDGMCGKYLVVGRVLKKSEEGMGFDKPFFCPPFPICEIDVERAVQQLLKDDTLHCTYMMLSHYR